MNVKCPYMDWEGEQAMLQLHLETHNIKSNPTVRKESFLKKQLNKQFSIKLPLKWWIVMFLLTAWIGAILGVVYS